MEQLSVVIITHNEEKNIGRCIDAAKSLADEIIVLDSLSTDNTINIARSKGAKVWQEPFRGYIGQKNRAIEFASFNYIFSIDADEVPDEKLISSICEAKKTFTYSAYKMKRCTNFCGRFIRFGTWYPDRKIRLFDKRVSRWGGINPHDKIIFDKPVAVKYLEGEILHYCYNTKKEYADQSTRFSSIAAISLYEAGIRTSLVKIIVNPTWAFINDYFIRVGFLNGKSGVAIAFKQAHYTFLKHIKLYRLQHRKPDVLAKRQFSEA
jgi:glycosyltransferase involved in cell wall biosynthesis